MIKLSSLIFSSVLLSFLKENQQKGKKKKKTTEARGLVCLISATDLVSPVILELIFWLILNLGMLEATWPQVQTSLIISTGSQKKKRKY